MPTFDVGGPNGLRPGELTVAENHAGGSWNISFFALDGGQHDIFAPIIAYVSPAAGPISPGQQVTITVLDNRSVANVYIWVRDGGGNTLLAYANGQVPPYAAVTTTIAGGIQIQILDTAAWPPGDVVMTVTAIDGDGNAVSSSRTWTVGTFTIPSPDPPDEAHDVVAQALSRVLTQYRDSTKLKAELELLAGMFQEIENALVAVGELSDIDIAGGVNLDVIGARVGQGRQLGNGTVVLDALYRTLIRMRITRNSSQATNPVLLAVLFQLFNATIRYRDYGDMSVGYHVARAPTADEIAILDSDLPPRAATVEIERSSYNPTNYFGFAANPNAHGYGVGQLATRF